MDLYELDENRAKIALLSSKLEVSFIVFDEFVHFGGISMSESPTSPWMTMTEVIQALDMGRLSVLAHVANGDIRRRQTSAQRRYLRSDVEKLAVPQQIPQPIQ